MESNITSIILWILFITVSVGIFTVVVAYISLMRKRSCPHCQTKMSTKATTCPYCGKGVLGVV